MTELSIEERLDKLEAQMQKHIERQNLLSELLYQQARLQQLSLCHLKTISALNEECGLFAQFLEQQRKQYDQILLELPLEDENGREYVRSLQNLLEY